MITVLDNISVLLLADNCVLSP